MGAPNFEFVVIGPAVPLRAAKKDAKRYQAWKRKVRSEAVKFWQFHRPIETKVSVTITNYFTEEPPDVDNLIKPILDALNLLVYNDDNQVQSVTSRKIETAEALNTSLESPLAEALEQNKEIIHIEVFWEEIL